MDRIGWGFGMLLGNCRRGTGQQGIDNTSKQISKGMSPGSSQNRENCEVMSG